MQDKFPLWQRVAAVAVWVLLWQLAASALGHGGLFLATPRQTVQALEALLPTTAFWRSIGFSTLRILLGANEETGMKDVDYYLEHYPQPAF